MGWSVEFDIYCDTSEDTDWVSRVVEPVTIDMNFSSTIGWSSKWIGLSNSWWVEEDEFQSFGNVLVVQSQLQLDVVEWWLEVVCW